MPKFSSIPQFTRSASYHVNYSWRYLENWLADQKDIEVNKGMATLNLDPDFQRGHVWTEEQQRRYVEFVLRGGRSARTLLFNCKGWQGSYEGPFVLVDGKQRLTAVLKFLHNELPIFDGHYYKDFEDKLPREAQFEVEMQCEYCDSTEGVVLEDSRTSYSLPDLTIYDLLFPEDLENPNRPIWLCRSCAEEHHEFWDEQWREYWDSIRC
jgi:hypothetical protein